MGAHALKEWAVTIEALRRGEQILILRKGGIGEKRFSLAEDRFYLLPTYLHQRPELVQERWRGPLAESLAAHDAEPSVAVVSAWAEVAASAEIRDPDDLARLADHHVLSEDYAAARLKWRRTQPLWAVALRAYEIDVPLHVGMTGALAGCVSWVSVDVLPRPEGGRPVLPDDAFGARLAALRAVLPPRTPVAA